MQMIAASGPMTFARFMTIALYDPARGYYRGAVARPGRVGDFLTAPEASPIFGRTLARFALAVHAAIGAPAGFTIREHGAGAGALAGPLVEALLAADGGPSEIRYLVVPMRPKGTEGWSEEKLADLVTRDSMIGTGFPFAPEAAA